jgi:hypothetical protein
MHLDMPLGSDANFIGIVADVLLSVRSVATQYGVPLEELGNLDTLPDRVLAEIAAANTVVGMWPLVSVWSRKPR